MIKLKSLHLKNFRSWSELKLDNIDQLGTVLLVGMNGAGKSSIRQAIEYLLLDKTSDDLKLSELPKDAGKNCMIHGEFEKAGLPFTITKYRNSDEFNNATFFEIEGDRAQTVTDRRVTQKNISAFLGLDNENTLYSSTIFSLRSPSFPELKESERKPILFDILPLSKYNEYLDTAKKKVEETKQLMSSIERDKAHYEDALVNELDSLRNNKAEIGKYNDLRQQQLKSVQQKLSELKLEDLAELEKQLGELKSKLSEAKANFDEKLFDELQKTVDKAYKKWYDKNKESEKLKETKLKGIENIKFQVSLRKKNSQLDEVDKKVKLEDELKELQNQFDQQEINELANTINSLNNEIRDREHEIKDINKELKSITNSECPLLNIFCQALKDNQDETKEKLDKRLEILKKDKESKRLEVGELEVKCNNLTSISSKAIEISNKIKELEKIISDKKQQFREADDSIKDQVNKLKDIKVKIYELEEEKEIYKKEMEDGQVGLKKFEESKVNLEKIKNDFNWVKSDYKHKLTLNATTEERKREYETQIMQIEKEENPYIKIEKAIKEQINTIKEEITKLENSFKENQDLLPYYEFWVRGFGKAGIPNMLCEEFLASLEYETNLILSKINDELTVTIDSQHEKGDKSVSEAISYEVHSPCKKITDYHSYSSGQQQRIKIADIFAFHKLNGYDFLILDELLELSLDEEGVEAVVRLIQEKSKEVSTMLVTSHNDKVKDSFDKVFYVEYENGNSFLRS